MSRRLPFPTCIRARVAQAVTPVLVPEPGMMEVAGPCRGGADRAMAAGSFGFGVRFHYGTPERRSGPSVHHCADTDRSRTSPVRRVGRPRPAQVPSTLKRGAATASRATNGVYKKENDRIVREVISRPTPARIWLPAEPAVAPLARSRRLEAVT